MASKPKAFRPAHLPKREERAKLYDRNRDQQGWRRWYKTARWQKLRAGQLAADPLCCKCKAAGRIVPANVCDHVERHRGDEVMFWSGPFQSLCTPCHSSEKQREERARLT